VNGVSTAATSFNAATGVATLVTPNSGPGALSKGTDKIYATYSADPLFNGNTSNTVTVTVLSSSPAASLTATPPATQVVANQPFSIKVTAYDSQGFVAATDNNAVSISLLGGPTGGTLVNPGGTGTFSAGVFTFNNLMVTVPGTYTLEITSGGLSTTVTFTTFIPPPPPPPPPGRGR
jgi:hypothetical protein